MSADLAARLRSLAHDHQAGRLSLAAYRKLRAPLLDSLALHGTRAADEKTQPRAVARSPELSRASRAPEPPPLEARRNVYWQAAIAFAVVLAIAGGLFWALRRSEPNEAVAVESQERKGPVQEAIELFVARGDWSDSRTAALNTALLELGPQQISQAATEPWFQRFVHDLRKRLKEQQALARVPLAAQTSPLAALAVTVGLDLDSPDAAIRIAPAAKPTEVVSTPPVTSAPRKEKPNSAATSERPRALPQTRPREHELDVARAAAEPKPAATATTAPAPRESTCRIELIRTRRPFCRDRLASGEDGPELALIPAGAFDMQNGAGERVRRVVIDEPFAMSVHEVSQAEFRLYCEHAEKPCAAQPWSGDDYPVVNVSWQDAHDYVEWLSATTGHRYRLPSEAQWEYAARGGQSTLVPDDGAPSPTDVHYSMLTKQEAPARRSQKFNDNGFRLLHTIGNVREWIEDAGANATRLALGGSYIDSAAKLKSSTREELPADTRDAFTGFRIVRELP